jgi:uncharacterized membrane protein (UPF0182 family)
VDHCDHRLFRFSFSTIVALFTDWFWFKEVQLAPVFVKTLVTKVLCFLTSGFAAGLMVFLNFTLAQRLSKTPYVNPSFSVMQFTQAFAIVPLLRILIPIASLFVAFLFGGWGGSLWETFLKFKSAVPFGATDQLFGNDIGFYVFSLPFYRSLYFSCVAIVGLCLAGSLFIYTVRQQCKVDGIRITISPAARAHLLTMIGLIVGSGFFYYQIKMFGMVNGGGHIVNGAGFADINYYIPILKLMRFVSLIAAALIFLQYLDAHAQVRRHRRCFHCRRRLFRQRSKSGGTKIHRGAQ